MEREDDPGRGGGAGHVEEWRTVPARKSRVILGWLRDTYCPGNRRRRIKAG